MTVSPALPSRETQLFLVHVWRQRERFRASVRRVDCEQTQLFTNPAQLARYLATVCGDAAPEDSVPGGHALSPSSP